MNLFLLLGDEARRRSNGGTLHRQPRFPICAVTANWHELMIQQRIICVCLS